MAAESEDNLRFEIGHVLFIDLVGYSKLLIEEQKERLRQLTEIVVATSQVAKSTNEQLVRLPTGDGMALVFRNSSEEPARCALEIAQALKKHPEIPVRMGIHSGPVSDVIDVSGRTNIAGAGINLAQRVMDCGDAGHILLSQHVADDLAQYRQWAPRLHDLGECEVKHGLRLHLVNLYAEELGNSALPEKFRQSERKPVAPAAPSPPRSKWLLFALAVLIFLLLGLAIVAIIFTPAAIKVLSHQRAPAPPPAPVFSVSPPVIAPVVPEKSIAVLPFENLSSDKENAYFAEGIQDEILTKLASIADLKVISRTSTEKYKSKPEDLKTVSQQLGVANVLEGTVQRAGDKVRINVQLIDARADAHLWAKSYDRDIKDVFAVESEVSQEIADALQAKLSPNEANTLATAPTKDPEAYDSYLKGEYEEREAEGSLKAERFDRAAAFYQEALNRDPNFALAAARLADSRMLRHWFVTRLSEAELAEVKRVADRALALAPNLAEAHLAMGRFYYYNKRQYDDALKEFRKALELQPNNANALQASAYIYRRQGQWARSLSELTKCEEGNPRDASLAANIGASYWNLRMWDDAPRAGARALTLDPHNLLGMRDVFFSYLFGKGDIDAAKRALATFPPDTRFVYFAAIGNSGMEFYLHVVERDFTAALKTCETETGYADEDRARLAAQAAVRVLDGNMEGAQDELEKARGLLEARVRERPEDEFAPIQLSWVYLALKRNADALRLAHQAVDLTPIEKDALTGSALLAALAEIQARAGETGEAVKTLRRLLSIPAGNWISLQQLKIDPVWDPIRKDPRFQKLLADPELIGPPK
jgi:serine/threonine-protein kinase